MEITRLPLGGFAWTSADGQVGLWPVMNGVFVFRLIGKGVEEFATPICEEFEAGLAKGGALHVFGDAERMERYDSRLRVRLTELFRDNRKQLASLHVVSRSNLVAMGVAVANLALGNVITVHPSRAHFKISLDNTLSAHNVVGFSSEVLWADGNPLGRKQG